MIMNIQSTIKNRHCVRAFLDKSVSQNMLNSIFDTARFAPSGKNSQPWQVLVLTGKSKQCLSDALVKACKAGVPQAHDYPSAHFKSLDPIYYERAFDCGMRLYNALDIKRKDKVRRMQQWLNNFTFFSAPAELIFLIDARLDKGAWVDYGMFLQNVMLAAEEFGLATCPQNAVSGYADIVRETLGLDKNMHVVTGMAIGFPDNTQAVNQYRTAREPVDRFVKYLD